MTHRTAQQHTTPVDPDCTTCEGRGYIEEAGAGGRIIRTPCPACRSGDEPVV